MMTDDRHRPRFVPHSEQRNCGSVAASASWRTRLLHHLPHSHQVVRCSPSAEQRCRHEARRLGEHFPYWWHAHGDCVQEVQEWGCHDFTAVINATNPLSTVTEQFFSPSAVTV